MCLSQPTSSLAQTTMRFLEYQGQSPIKDKKAAFFLSHSLVFIILFSLIVRCFVCPVVTGFVNSGFIYDV